MKTKMIQWTIKLRASGHQETPFRVKGKLYSGRSLHFPGGASCKDPPVNVRDRRDMGLIPREDPLRRV